MMIKKWVFRLLLGLLIFAGMLFAVKVYKDYKAKKARETYVAGLVHTASPNVQILKDTIMVDYLGTKRTLSIYLPADYTKDTLAYPVVYFMDGQSLFDEKILEGDEWQIDEVLDSLGKSGGMQAIVVGVYNAEDRLTEYKPFLSPHVPSEKSVSGDKHAEWIATDLKKWVDTKHRLPNLANYTQN
ncbi:MAG: alpha/beta hydrolase-fold protein [Saprospiraceae bacterium]